MDMVANGFVGTLAKSLEEGKVTMAEIDEAVRRILEAKYRIGLFENPYKYADPSRKNEIYTPEKRAEARRIAAKTFVLLKNEGDILPIQKKGTIAVIGPMGNTRANMPGTWSVAADLNNYKSVYEASAMLSATKPKSCMQKAQTSLLTHALKPMSQCSDGKCVTAARKRSSLPKPWKSLLGRM